ncbi:hypothetical protein [Variovorax terrae]|uniref:Uncharacterized protein n=1 Tax=Variovorax terrae TaxID=2923278 RepID=A0A9X2ARS4_9BURK|nr:hypothetical protein [Variovorax terrae]MCJ0764511.1 hypothetical protein [Variovorax terrae]
MMTMTGSFSNLYIRLEQRSRLGLRCFTATIWLDRLDGPVQNWSRKFGFNQMGLQALS